MKGLSALRLRGSLPRFDICEVGSFLTKVFESRVIG
jgi:hypothetical protein